MNTTEIAKVRNLPSCQATLALKGWRVLLCTPACISNSTQVNPLYTLTNRSLLCTLSLIGVVKYTLSHPCLQMNMDIGHVQLKSLPTSATKVYGHFDVEQRGRWGGNTNLQENWQIKIQTQTQGSKRYKCHAYYICQEMLSILKPFIK